MKKEVLIIFKTHLDLGFTDYAETILEKYLQEYIPTAIKIGYELKNSASPFVWNVGSWLIWQALKNDKDGSVERALRDGILSWLALPFTTHTELMSAELFEYGLSLSKRLDERFGVNTVGAKMTDVPGHTLGMIPIMKKYGVNFLHIGVNPASPLPPTPPIFKWRYAGEEITVMYQGDYGEVAEFDDFIVYFAHTGDNLGPQSAEEIVDIYKKVQEKYPDCSLKAGTVNELAIRLANLKNLPVVEKEIGDTWIHGAQTDPQKTSRFRKLLRKLSTLSDIPDSLADTLLCVPEHTWGMDVKTHFPFDKFYTHQEMEGLREERKKIEKSWQEQRAYVEKAEKILGVTSDYPVASPDLNEYAQIEIPSDFPFEISWELFDSSDYERYKRDFMRCHVDWAIWDLTKPNLPDYKGGVYIPKITRAYQKGSERLYRLEFEKALAEKYGLPYFYLREDNGNIEIKWFEKRPSRLPQAIWFKIKGLKEGWSLQKMGAWIDQTDIIGSPFICGVDKGVKNGEVLIECLDSALVAPFGRRLLQYGVKNCKPDLYFNLYNNIWNTNFPVWYSDDGLFRFTVQEKK